MMEDVLKWIFGACIGVITFFLRRIIKEIDEMKDQLEKNTTDIAMNTQRDEFKEVIIKERFDGFERLLNEKLKRIEDLISKSNEPGKRK